MARSIVFSGEFLRPDDDEGLGDFDPKRKGKKTVTIVHRRLAEPVTRHTDVLHRIERKKPKPGPSLCAITAAECNEWLEDLHQKRVAAGETDG